MSKNEVMEVDTKTGVKRKRAKKCVRKLEQNGTFQRYDEIMLGKEAAHAPVTMSEIRQDFKTVQMYVSPNSSESVYLLVHKNQQKRGGAVKRRRAKKSKPTAPRKRKAATKKKRAAKPRMLKIKSEKE